MPQLDFGNPLLIAQVVWLLIIFGVLYYILKNFTLPRVGEVVEARERRIAADLDAARDAQAQADAAIAELRAATAQARAEAQAAVAAAAAEANAAAAKQAEEINARLAAQIEQAETRVRAARDQAMAALNSVAADAAGAMLAKLGVPAPANDVAAAVEAAASAGRA
jgi:F-type H+-transporting ATPase subunit b